MTEERGYITDDGEREAVVSDDEPDVEGHVLEVEGEREIVESDEPDVEGHWVADEI